jgi:hypothetical protein
MRSQYSGGWSEIDLSGNNLSDKSAQALAEVLQMDIYIKSINLQLQKSQLTKRS